jgi:AbrB family looped-hinge helix DNA binding protein
MKAVKVGKRGTIIVPAKLRKRYGIEEETLVTAEARGDGVLIRPAVVLPVERYTPERKAEFLLSSRLPEEEPWSIASGLSQQPALPQYAMGSST